MLGKITCQENPRWRNDCGRVAMTWSQTGRHAPCS